jgi:hypothetical protein
MRGKEGLEKLGLNGGVCGLAAIDNGTGRFVRWLEVHGVRSLMMVDEE